MKPILFNTKMVRALQNGTKTVTRWVVKLKYSNTHLEMKTDKYGTRLIELHNEEPGVTIVKNPDGITTRRLLAYVEKIPPYHPGDILYVQETFRVDYLSNIPGAGRIHYKADDAYADFSFSPCRYDMMRRAQLKPGWRPNENMPREAARIFLRVTDVRVERLQDITEEQARAEGALPVMITTDVDKPEDEQEWHECLPALPDFINLWDSTIKKADRALYGWDANPWVWPIEFERISREEAMKGDT